MPRPDPRQLTPTPRDMTAGAVPDWSAEITPTLTRLRLQAAGLPSGAPVETVESSAEAEPELVDDPDVGLSGKTLGQYSLGRMIGKGSMGRVYIGVHLGLNRVCAVKALHPARSAKDPRIREQFLAEARAIAELSHPNVVLVYNIGADRGWDYIEMEYIPHGVSLREMVEWHAQLPPLQVTEWMRQVALALDHAHQRGLIHRDVKPGNVLLTPRGQVKLADFGLVLRQDAVGPSQAISGTPAYMAPELFVGEAATVRSDVYALGVMFHQLLAGRLPYQANKLMHLYQLHATQPIEPLAHQVEGVPEELDEILRRCMAKAPDERFGSAGELASALRTILFHQRDVGRLLTESLEQLHCRIEPSGNQFLIFVDLGEGRTQELEVETICDVISRQRALTIAADCGPATPDAFELVLRLNAELSFAGISVRDRSDGPRFAMSHRYPLGQVTPADINRSVREIAQSSDWVKRQLA